MTKTGIRELRAKLSAYLRRVKAGETIIIADAITDHGKPIGRIIPYSSSVAEQLSALRQAGLIEWNGQRLSALTPVAQTKGKQTVADLLLEDRE